MAQFQQESCAQLFRWKSHFSIAFFGTLNQIMKQQTTFLIFLSILRYISIVITSEFKNKFLAENLKNGKGYLQFLARNVYLNFEVITIGIYRGILKKIKNVTNSFIIWLNAPTMRL